MIGAGELADRETFLTSQLTMKVLQRMRQISTTGERIGRGIGKRREYRYHPWTDTTIPTPKPTAVYSNTTPLHPQVKGSTTEEKRRWENYGTPGLMTGTAVARWPRSPY